MARSTGRSISSHARAARPSADNFRLVESRSARRARARCSSPSFPQPRSVHARPHQRRKELRPAAAARPGDAGRHRRRRRRLEHPGYKAGDSVVGFGGWQEYSIVDAGIPACCARSTPAASALRLPRRGRHAGRHRVVRPDEDLPAQGRARRSSSAPRTARWAASSASSPSRAAAARSASPAAPTSALRDRRARLRRLRRLQGARRFEVALPGAQGSDPDGVDAASRTSAVRSSMRRSRA